MARTSSDKAGPIGIEDLPFDTDPGLAARARIGLVVLASDHTVEHEFRTILDLPGVAFYASRIPNSQIITPESLAAMEGHIASRSAVILPGMELDVVAYGCTSASIVLGEEKVFACIRQGRPEARPTTPVTAALAAFEALGARRIAVITPYSRAVNERVGAYIAERGYEVPVFGSFNSDDDNVVARISPESIRRAILEMGRRDDVDMVFLSCTSLRLAEAAGAIEAELGKPVTSSNNALAWHCLRLAGIADRQPRFGRLHEL
ncbi:MAG TPA: aspartate/glutamate racemase family protein [Afifellaceae bacterium]|nr:aspartate/glutamate racemase family protein [Afifellaceae bacterium]